MAGGVADSTRGTGVGGVAGGRVGGVVNEEMTKETEFEMLRAEIQALRQSVWHIEQMALSQTAAAQENEGKGHAVTVSNVSIGFWAMVVLMVKAAFAAIPAIIIIFLIWLVLAGVLSGVFASLVP